MRSQDDSDVNAEATTSEVASEGGSSGDIEVARKRGPGVGSERGETWRPSKESSETIARDNTGEGRRSP